MHDDEVTTDAALVARLIAEQFPDWGRLPVVPVASSGTDNAIYRLGDDLSVRLPRIHWAVAPVQREFAWLPRIATELPFEVPLPVALGDPGPGFEWPWTVCRWLDGIHPAVGADSDDETTLAHDLARFVRAMASLDPAGAPTTAWPRPLHEEDELVRAYLGRLDGELGSLSLDRSGLARIWDTAITASPHAGPRVWIHGDLSPGNLLLREGRLTGVLDFGAMGLGDPASDYRVAWNLLSTTARVVFRAEVGADEATWARARGWALLQALAQLAYFRDRNPPLTATARHVLAALVTEHT